MRPYLFVNSVQERVNHIEAGSMLHTDEHCAYQGIPGYQHNHVKHSEGKYTGTGDITKNSIESMWALLKRELYGTWHKASRKHFAHYVNECTFRLNVANVRRNTLDRLDSFTDRALRHSITYEELTA